MRLPRNPAICNAARGVMTALPHPVSSITISLHKPLIHDWIGILHCAPGRRLEERQVRHAGMRRRTTYHARPMPITTYPGILPPGTMDRRAPAIMTSTAMNKRFVALSIVDQVCRVRGSEPCQPFRTGEPALFLCSPISGSSIVNNHYKLTNLSGIRYYRNPNWPKARESSCFISIPYDERDRIRRGRRYY